MPPDPAAWSTADRARWALGESRAALDGVWQTVHALWINAPQANRLAGAKLHQLRRARELGFAIPPTIVTNDRDTLRAFVKSGQGVGGVICKPIEEGRLELAEGDRLFFTSPLDVGPEDLLDDFGPEPYLFQQLIPKDYDLRVTVIGDTVFATRIESQPLEEARIDWRRAGTQLKHAADELPAELRSLCLELTRSYGLEFGAIDLARTPDGKYVFFEINPNGQWAWIEQLTGQPLRATMADLLARGQR